ncbi:PRMT5 arginine-N-methyltransferase-domain-containing protein [Ampelomyces quisqualis]|uniref:Protein arginine N-methyltransferase n=1 Tax=Ampelomyces quisqualis TaxID=50730 RepID=A0A6A5QKF3_AMPQU|nr:PRMT5 arginine-N-methyltransferase-domain-containing protein [Ampelomyces quisqualis]
MSYSDAAEPSTPVFYIGHHETRRTLAVSPELVQHAQDLGYDMLTSPITNDHFHTRVLSLLNSYSLSLADAPHHQPLPLIPALDHPDTPLGPTDTIGQLVTFTSSWTHLASPDPVIAHISRQVFHLEVAYAAFCGATTVVVPGPRLSDGQDGVARFARAIKEALAIGSYLQLHVQLPMDGSATPTAEEMGHLASFASSDLEANRQAKNNPWSSWEAWNTIRTICKYSNRLSVALDLPRTLPSLALQSRWYSEPVRLLNLPASSFILNQRQSFVLSRSHQAFIFRCARLRSSPWLLVTDVGPLPGIDDPDMIMSYSTGHLSPRTAEDAPSPESSNRPAPTPAEAAQLLKTSAKPSSSSNDPTPHLSYLRYIQRNQPPKSQLERFGGGFQDYLQSPLQPLTDNLESITYEVFEKDPIKYAWYERAIAQALGDWHEEKRPTSSGDGVVVIAVVGSGRGPLVTRALNASASTGVPVRVFAIEKNPNAYVLLQRHNVGTWGGRVTVVKTDMRAWKGPTLADGTFGKVDILVSELLGSFADNELSPECLDGVQHVLNPDHGISIPCSYTAHFTPISTPRLWSDLHTRSTSVDSNAFDIPWVVMLSQFDFLSTDRKETATSQQLKNKSLKMSNFNLEAPLAPIVHTAWEFSHPLPPTVLVQASLRKGGSAIGGGGGFVGGDGANEHNYRDCCITFPIQEPGVCHGLGGYFETVLYSGSQGPVELSTNPVTMEAKSKDMISWFPIFFPLKVPMQLPAKSEVQVSFWRHTDDRKVWYEWLVESFMTTGDQRVKLGTSDLHSSRTNGCMM